MPADVLTLAGQVDGVNRALARAGMSSGLPPVPKVRVLVLGPADAGKTTLVGGILGESAAHLPGMLGARLRTGIPVEIKAGPSGSATSVIVERIRFDGRPRSVSVSPASKSVFADKRARRVRVELDAAVLRDWHIELVDNPASDRHQGHGPRPAPDPAFGADLDFLDGVLYVIPSRGLIEQDLHVLASLRGRPVVVVQNLREADISVSTSSFSPIPVRLSACEFALPVALSRVSQPGAQRNLIRLAFTLLHAVVLAPELRLLREAAQRTFWQLRKDYRARFDAVLAVCGTGFPEGRLPVLHAAAALRSIERDGYAQADAENELAALIAALAAMPAADGCRSLLSDQARAAADRYDVEAVSQVRARPWLPPRRPDSRASFRSVRTLGNCATRCADIRELLDDAELRLTEADRASLAAIGDQIAEDRLEVIFAGQFSAGKSTLINALLATELLPARRRPTTATINKLRYAETTTLKPLWLEADTAMELTLLEATSSARGSGRRLMEDGRGTRRVPSAS
jgi:Dynamin family